MKVTPASRAAWIVAIDWASSGRPAIDIHIPPRPIAETRGPSGPSFRMRMSRTTAARRARQMAGALHSAAMAAADYDPEQYARFAAERRAPFDDLLALVRPAP